MGGGAKMSFISQKMLAPLKKCYSPKSVYTNVLMYERWLVLNVWYTAHTTGRPLLMHVSQKLINSNKIDFYDYLV